MTMLINCLLVGCGGFVGSVGRYLAGQIPAFHSARLHGFPLATLLVNLLGAFLIGALAAAIPPTEGKKLLFLKVGICGGFTTFSTFSLETLELLEHGRIAMGIVYAAASFLLCLAGVWIGKWLVTCVKVHM